MYVVYRSLLASRFQRCTSANRPSSVASSGSSQCEWATAWRSRLLLSTSTWILSLSALAGVRRLREHQLYRAGARLDWNGIQDRPAASPSTQSTDDRHRPND